jgi:hypothetical protein
LFACRPGDDAYGGHVSILKEPGMSADVGLRIISVAKTLEAYQSGDANVSRYFGASRMAGRGGLLASSLRLQRRITYEKFEVHASEAKIDGPMLSAIILPWLQKSGFVEVNDGRTTVDCHVIDYEAILKATFKLFEYLKPTPEERTVLTLFDLSTQMPTTKATAFAHITDQQDKVIEVALDLASGYNVVRESAGEASRSR